MLPKFTLSNRRWSPFAIQPTFCPPSVSDVVSLATPAMPEYASAWIREVASMPVDAADVVTFTALLDADRLPGRVVTPAR